MATGSQLAALNRQRNKKIIRELSKATLVCEYRIHGTAQRISSGQVSTATLSAPPPGLNHPYGHYGKNSRGRRGPIPYGDPGVINQQTGTFKASWDTVNQIGLNHVTIVLFNSAPYAKYMQGTSLMIHRPILERVQKIEYPLFLADMTAAWKRGLRP